MKPKVVRHTYNKKDNDKYCYIGRPSKFGNPLKMNNESEREKVVSQFREYAYSNQWILDNINMLTGKEIGCYCAPKACHGDVLVEIWEKENQ